ncbi:MAG: NTP transferase domain-containing protein, partial [Bradymonadaceae bacterium]
MFSLALIPAAGRGARLDRPATPKPLVDVGGRPLIIDVLMRLQAAGVTRAVVVVGYRGEQVVRHLTNHPDLDLKIEFVEHAGWQQGLASSILAARDHIDEPFVLAMSDHLFDPALVEHITSADLGADDGVMLVDQQLDEIYDLDDAVKVHLDGERVTDASRNLNGPHAVDAGLFAFRPAIFDALEEALAAREPADLTDAVRLLGARGKLRAVFTDGARWHDIDTPPALIRAEMEYRAKRRKDTVNRPQFAAPAQAETHVYP